VALASRRAAPTSPSPAPSPVLLMRSSGLVMQLTAASIGAEVGGGQATATGVDTGKVDLDTQPSGDLKVAVTDFRIAHATSKSAPKLR
jgi:hypothetical protein